AQLQMTVGMVFQFVAAPDQLLCCVKAANADVFLMPGFAPRLGRKSPADHKKCRLHAILIQDIDQPLSRMRSLAAEQDIWPGTIVKGKRDKLAARRSRSRVCDSMNAGRRSVLRH